MITMMAYLLMIAALLGLAALVGERICAELGKPRRAAWLVALVASVSVPAFAIFAGAASSAAIPVFSLPPLLDQMPLFGRAVDGGTVAATAAPAFSWPDWRIFDAALTTVWIVCSAALLIVYGFAALRIRVMTRRAPALTIGGRHVLLSDDLGPAVLGFLSPRIVLPRWLAQEDSALRLQVLRHESEHIAARDQLALLAALLLVAFMPWNVALWWQLRRLRAAIEVDCDRRVLSAGADAGEYSRALLTVGRHAPRTPFAAVALTEPVSELERRITIMLARTRDFSPAGFGARIVLVAAALTLAFALNAPQAQQADATEAASVGQKVIPTIRSAVYELLSEAQQCMEREDMACVDRVLAEVREIPDLNSYEMANLHNFSAFAAFDHDDVASAVAAYEAILALPHSELPDGFIGSTMRNLAILYLQQDRLQAGLDTFDRWLALPFVRSTSDDTYVLASILYRLERYEDALGATQEAIAGADEPRESWYELLYALQSQLGDQAGAARTLATLNERWPDAERARLASPAIAEEAGSGGLRFGVADGEYLPIVKVAPVYPPRAAQRGIEGYVVVQYTVTATGATRDAVVVESSSTLFEQAAIESVLKFKYKPRIVDGTPVEVAGVTTKITFALPEEG